MKFRAINLLLIRPIRRFGIRAAGLLFLAACAACSSAPSVEAPDGSLTRQMNQVAQQSDEATQRALEECTRKVEGMWRDLGIEGKQEGMIGELKAFFGTDDLKSKVDASEKLAAQIVVTEQDLRALDSYAHGDYEKAEFVLREALRAGPKRPFTLFVQGCVLLDEGKYGEAAASFDEAFILAPESRTCLLLAGMSSQLLKAGQVNAESVRNAYDVAYRDCMNRLPVKEEQVPSLLSAFTSPITFDPIRVRFSTAAIPIIQERRLGIVRDMLRDTDIDRQIALARMIEEKAGRLVIMSLAKKHPENKQLNVYAFLLRYFGGGDESNSERGPNYAADLAAAQALEPENGLLLFLGIDTTDDSKPLDAAEVALFRRAAQCKEFHSYADYEAAGVRKEYLTRPGAACETGNVYVVYSTAQSAVRNAVRRAGKTIVRLFENKQDKEAWVLISDVDSIASRVRSERDEVMQDLLADGLANTVARALGRYAERAHRDDLMEKSLSDEEATARLEFLYCIAAKNAMGLYDLPTLRARECIFGAESKSLMRERGLRGMHLYAESLKAEATKEIEDALEFNRPPNSDSIITLQQLRDQPSLPLLEKLTHSQDALTRRLATRAVAEMSGATGNSQ